MSQHTQVDGIEFWATQSYFQTTNTRHQDGQLIPFNILQRAFTYEDSTTTSDSPQGEYLSVKLDTLGAGSIQDEKNNCIIVSGMAAREADSIGEDVIRFEHVFVTNFQRETLGGDEVFSSFFPLYLWDFQNQTVSSTNWSPSGLAEGWRNGADAVNGTYWSQSLTPKTVYKFGCEDGPTGSGGTGPDGGMGGNNPFTTTPTNGLKYIYTEASSGRNAGQFLVRMPGINFSEVMSDTSNNLKLAFLFHNFSSLNQNSNMKLRVYIDTAAASTHEDATLLQTISPIPTFDFSSTKWNYVPHFSPFYIDLNSYRTVDATHYIYITVEGGTGYASDVGLDYFRILEDDYHQVRRETSFTQDLRSGPDATLILSSSIDYISTNTDKRVDPTIKFRLFSRDGVDLYVKGTYLLM